MRRRDSLESRGLRSAIVERFADGAWHTIDEVVAACGHLIPPELAVRRADESRINRAVAVRERVERGRSVVVRQSLRALSAEPGGEGRFLWQRFRLAPGKLGTDYGQKCGAAARTARLTEAQVREIRLRYALGSVSLTQLGRDYGVSQSNISAIIRRKSWGHVA